MRHFLAVERRSDVTRPYSSVPANGGGAKSRKARKYSAHHTPAQGATISLNRIEGEGFGDLLVGVKMKDFGGEATPSASIVERDAAHSGKNRKQLEFQVGNQIQRLPPVRTDGGFATKPPRWFAGDLDDYGRRHFEVFRIVREDSPKIVSVPRFNPLGREAFGKCFFHEKNLPGK